MDTKQLCMCAAALISAGVLVGCDRKPQDTGASSSSRSQSTTGGSTPSTPPATPITPGATMPPGTPPPSSDTGTPSPGGSTAPTTPPSPGTSGSSTTPGSTPSPPGDTRNPGPGSSLDGTPRAQADQAFVTAALGRGLADSEAGRLVAREGGDAQVKTFAGRLQDEQSVANVGLVRLASERRVDLYGVVPAAARADLDELRRLSGAELDARFLARFGSAAGEESLAAYAQAARDSEDPEIRALAQEALAALQEHRDAAQALQQTLAAASGGR